MGNRPFVSVFDCDPLDLVEDQLVKAASSFAVTPVARLLRVFEVLSGDTASRA